MVAQGRHGDLPLRICANVVENAGPIGSTHGVFGVFVLEKPVVMHFALLLRDAADDNGSLWRTERIIIDFN